MMCVLGRHIEDTNIRWLIGQVLKSFHTTAPGVGLPLGNLTSQLLVNIYMHKFDMYMKQELRAKYYIRYADDFVILSEDKEYLENLLPKIELFLRHKLHLSLHPDKVSIQTSYKNLTFMLPNPGSHFVH